MRPALFARFLRANHPPCSPHRVHLRFSSQLHESPTHAQPSPEEAVDLAPDFGDYSIILPPEPFQFGTSHFHTLPIPSSIALPPYMLERERRRATGESDAEINGAGDLDPYPKDGKDRDGRIELGGQDEVGVRAAATLAREVREYAGSLVKVGVTTAAIDSAIHEYIVAHGAYPSPRLYSGFPRSSCTSVNNIIAHGIPDARPLEDGDIVNIDVTVYLGGFHGDTSRTFLVGNVDKPGRELVNVTTETLEAGISACGPGKHFRGIGKAIQELALQRGHSVSSQFTGHGIGRVFHRPPWILHDKNDEPGVMKPGHCFTIEPCIIQGSNPRGWIFPDGWTTSTENCARSAQEEHMVLITHTGADVLTR